MINLNKYKFIVLLSICITTSCKSTLPIEYQLANDIIEEQVDKNAKTFFINSCGYNVDYKRFHFISRPINRFNSYLEKKHRNQSYVNIKYAWVFSEDDLIYLNKYIDSITNLCWDKTKIKNKELFYFSKKELDEKYTYEMNKKYHLKELERPIKKEDQVIYLSKPFINKTKDKALFLYKNSKVSKGITKKIAVATKIKGKWTIIGYMYDRIN